MLPILNYITWNVSPFIYEGEHFAIGWYGTLWVFGLLLWILSQWLIYRHEGIESEYVWYKFLYLCTGLLIGARVGHCWFYEWYQADQPLHFLGVTFTYRNLFIEKPWLMFDLSHGVHGLSSHGGGIGLIIAVWLLNRHIFHTGLIWIFDRAVFGVCLTGACIRLGNFFNSEIYGNPTDLPWGVLFVNNGDILPCHPTQIYEMLYCLITFGVLVWLYMKRDAGKYNGLLFGVFLICIFLTRIILECIKQDQAEFESHLLGLNMGQWLSIPFLAAGVWLFVHALKIGKLSPIKPNANVQTENKDNHQSRKIKKRTAMRLLILSLTFISCTKNPMDDNPYDGKVEVIRELTDVYEEGGILCRSHCIIYTYESLNTDGEHDLFSGIITINENTWLRHQTKGVVLWNHPTISADEERPSNMQIDAEPLIAKFTGCVVVSPDLQGFGANTHNPQAYCFGKANARVATDGVLAAQKLLRKKQFSCPLSIYNVGYSQGAQTAMEVLNIVSQDYPSLSIRRTFVGAGPYDMLFVYNDAMDKQNLVFPAMLPLTICAIKDCNKLEWKDEELFSPIVAMQCDKWIRSKTYSVVDLAHNCPRNINQILSSNLQDEKNPLTYQLKNYMSVMSVCLDEFPNRHTNIYFFHSTEDDIIPVQVSENFAAQLKTVGWRNVQTDFKAYGTHDMAVLPFLKKVVLQIILS